MFSNEGRGLKIYRPALVFLSQDPDENARFLPNRNLFEQLKHLNSILFTVLYFCVGIRTQRAFKYWFDKKRKTESMRKFFPTYDEKELGGISPFIFYKSPEAKWARKCGEHYMLLAKHLDSACREFVFRYGQNAEKAIRSIISKTSWFITEPIQLGIQGYPLKMAGLKKIILPYKNLPPQFRRADVVRGYREWFFDVTGGSTGLWDDTKREIPPFMISGSSVQGEKLFED